MTTGRILLIEDDPDLMHLMAWRLRRRGHEVAVAFDGSEGYFAALREQPDVIVLDLLLPGFTGNELLHLLRTNPDIGRVPILVISALDRASRDPRTAAHASESIDKPFDLEFLIRRIENHLDAGSASHRMPRLANSRHDRK